MTVLDKEYENAVNEVARLAAAIRKHRDQRGDDRCFLDDYELYAVLGDPIPDRACKLDDPETMLSNCRRFIQSRHDPAKPYCSPQREIERLLRVEESAKNLCACVSVTLSTMGQMRESLAKRQAELMVELYGRQPG